jgi:hypothetical protein
LLLEGSRNYNDRKQKEKPLTQISLQNLFFASSRPCVRLPRPSPAPRQAHLSLTHPFMGVTRRPDLIIQPFPRVFPIGYRPSAICHLPFPAAHPTATRRPQNEPLEMSFGPRSLLLSTASHLGSAMSKNSALLARFSRVHCRKLVNISAKPEAIKALEYSAGIIAITVYE